MPESGVSHGDILAEIRANREGWSEAVSTIRTQNALILESLGRPSDDGRGGSGLWGELRRTQAIVDDQNSLIKEGRGFLIAITMSAGTIFIALKIGAANAITALARALAG